MVPATFVLELAGALCVCVCVGGGGVIIINPFLKKLDLKNAWLKDLMELETFLGEEFVGSTYRRQTCLTSTQVWCWWCSRTEEIHSLCWEEVVGMYLSA